MSSTSRWEEIEEAFCWDDDYDIVLALVHLTTEKYEKPDYDVLSEGEKIAIFINWFDAEVANGGFHQFFSNYSGDKWHEILHSLRSIGAVNTARIFEIALSVFPNSNPATDWSERNRQLRGMGKQTWETLFALDQEYYHQEEHLFTLAARYLKDRKSDFL